MATKPKLNFYEIFQLANNAPTPKARIAVLHQYSSLQLKELLNIMFNPKIKWLVPPGKPELKKLEGDIGSLVLALQQQHNFRKIPIFLNVGGYAKLNQMRRENTFIDFLGSIHPQDAELLCHIKDKTWPFDNLTADLIKTAYPKFTKMWGA